MRFKAWLASRFKGKWARVYWREDFAMQACDHRGDVVEGWGGTHFCGSCGAALSVQFRSASNTNVYRDVSFPSEESGER